MRTNVPAQAERKVTYEGGPAELHTKPLADLERSVATCMLFENTFYEKGSEIAKRIAELSALVSRDDLAALAVRARHEFKLRHVPLFLLCQLTKHHKGAAVGNAIAQAVRRPDEAGELLALYWKDGKRPLSKQMKRGLALAFQNWNEYQLAKWNRDATVKLRDALFLCHAKPKDVEQEELWKRLVDGTLAMPDTWEVSLSSGADKKATWERLLTEKKIGYMALLMNLRNMTEAGVETALVESALDAGAAKSWALPFRFVSAAKAAPKFAGALSEAMIKAVAGHEKLPGLTVVLVDVSGSMDVPLSDRGTLHRIEAAGAMAILCREVCASARVFTFSNAVVEVANYRGLPMLGGIAQSQQHGGTYLGKAVAALESHIKEPVERMIIVTDEQAHDRLGPCWPKRGYVVNVAPHKNGVTTEGGWTRVNGWSERVLDYIRYEEGAALVESEAD